MRLKTLQFSPNTTLILLCFSILSQDKRWWPHSEVAFAEGFNAWNQSVEFQLLEQFIFKHSTTFTAKHPIQKPVKGSQNAAKKEYLRQSCFGKSNRGLVMAVTQSALQRNQSLHQRGKALVLKWAKQHQLLLSPSL